MSELEKLLIEMQKRLENAKQQRPDVDSKDLLCTFFGEEKAQSIEEFNKTDEDMIFTCMKCDEAEYIVPKSTKKFCESCWEQVWMSPATSEVYSKIKKVKVLCLECSFNEAQNVRNTNS